MNGIHNRWRHLKQIQNLLSSGSSLERKQIITNAHNFTCAGVHVKPKGSDQKKTICEHPKMAAKLSNLTLFLSHLKFGTNKQFL